METDNVIKLVITKAVEGKLTVDDATEIIKSIVNNKENGGYFIYPSYPCLTPTVGPTTNPYDPYKVTCSSTNNI
jgi:hypothetical protein